ncbi:hypothetical protein Pan44_39140 [Caulifigura coniformis]|uniref:DUF2997 domain-containing protein n=1 Tax=Caulifigura coniformis TaxID=2527983 RepID=A0A517SIB4_9PLAN|nr:DUF2997 domain-containing protein [Caulifigura coniformis]QDT55866.1 hypothetical protein Pan44_39140 [Caulifigura coniformis]
MKSIELIISPNGQIRLETLGFTGTDCLPAAEFLRKGLGHIVGETRTQAFYAASTDAGLPLPSTPPRS